MIADNRGTALGIADKDGGKDKANIHDNAVSGHAIGAAQARSSCQLYSAPTKEADRFVISSLEPLVQALSSALPLNTGRTKCSRLPLPGRAK